MPTALLIGAHDDPHVHLLAQEVERLNWRAFILDARNSDNFISCRIAQRDATVMNAISRDGDGLDLLDTKSVWNRLKPLIPGPAAGPLETSAGEFAQREWKTILQSLRSFLKGARWINDVDFQFHIAFKPIQLKLACELGFLVPDTLITNNPKDILAMFDKHSRVIYKPLNGFVFPDQTGILTTEVSRVSVQTRSVNIRKAPGIFQQFIEKDFELRVTVVGSEVFPALIRTPKSGSAAIDWRHAHFEDIFENFTLDEGTKDLILQFHHASHLWFAAYDFAVDSKGDLYFLECNPAGQFLWLEHALGLQITNAIARCLCMHSSMKTP